jgi:trigger factor
MQVTEILNQDLSRKYGVRIAAEDLGAALEARIAEITPTLKLKGFRPGKVPPGHVRRLYGKALMGEVIEKTINETSQQVLADHRLRVATQPDLTPSSDMEQVLAGQTDLTYDLHVEVMPEFEPLDVSTLALERLVYEPTEDELTSALNEISEQNRRYEPREGKKVKAQTGDQIVMDFVGAIDGKAFEGGAATDAELVIGSGRFIPGFEDQLIGAAPGQSTKIETVFPDDYPAAHLKGKTAVFEVSVKAVRAPAPLTVDDALAESLGMADLAALREAVLASMSRQYEDASRFKLKRALLDALDKAHSIPLPSRMVEAEFQGIWSQVEKDRQDGASSPEDEGKSEETLRSEYRKIAERRVRLGLVLAEIGRRESVEVTDRELFDAMRNEALKYGENAQQIFDFMRQSPQVQSNLRAPLYEDKVVDLILSRAQVKDRSVSKDELLKEEDLPEDYKSAEAGAEESERVPTSSTAAEPASPAKPKAPRKPRTKAAPPEAAPGEGD